MKKYKCEFKFQNINTGSYVSIFFYMEGGDKYAVERSAIVAACQELSAALHTYTLNYYRIDEAV